MSCANLGISKLLEALNDILYTSYTLDDDPMLAGELQAFIDHECDFGTAYARLRPHWDQTPRSDAKQEQEEFETNDRERRQKAVNSKNQIIDPRVKPRRVWDLYSNRVVPYWSIHTTGTAQPIGPISHAWMSSELRQNVNTPINSYEWPVPIPMDTSLERVRIELLNLGLSYVWLDVLCLRQEGRPEKEPLRLEEWRLDVPTIGNIYDQNQSTICYYSGLGRPFQIGNLDSERHWLKRAWTLQETTVDSITAGVTPKSPSQLDYDKDTRSYRTPIVGKFYETLGSLATYAHSVDHIFSVLGDMRCRAAVNELDKIAGLTYLLRSKVLPTYIPSQPPEDAWRRLVETISPTYRGEMLFRCPLPGNGRHIWYPSWSQVKEMVLPERAFLYEEVEYDQQSDIYFSKGYRINNCSVEGFAEAGDGQERRRGKIIITGKAGLKFNFTAFAYHSQPVPDGRHTLVGSRDCEYWVVGRVDAMKRIEKVSVIFMSPGVDYEIAERLEELSGGQQTRITWA